MYVFLVSDDPSPLAKRVLVLLGLLPEAVEKEKLNVVLD